MKMKKKTVIVLSSILAGILSLTAFGYFRFFGPISVNLDEDKIDRIGFLHASFGEDYVTTYLDASEKEAILEQLQTIKFRKAIGGCRCDGIAHVVIEYWDNSQVKFDGYYLNKISSSGDTTSYSTQPFDALIAELYQEYIFE